MKQWDIWTCDFADAGPHPAIIVSHPDRVARAPLVKCDLMYLVEKERLYHRRGSVGVVRRRALVQRLNACFGFTLV
jgi:hypothetical protein